MPTPSLLITAWDPQIVKKVEALQPVPGYCIFIDIVGSTAVKQRDIRHWIFLFCNFFERARDFLLMNKFPPLKSMGDALMYYIELPDLIKSGWSPLQIFDGLWHIATETDPNYPPVRIGAARCDDVYSLTFLPGNQDYYGIDIDMTARLQRLAQERQVVIERRFYEEIAADHRTTGNRDQFVSVLSLRGPTLETLKGISNPVAVYRTER